MKRGFTLVELIVSVLVILFLLALLIPWLGDGRGPSRSNTCKNDEHNLALALLQYEAQHRAFPGYTQKLAKSDASWGVMILPHLERDDLWLDWNAGKPAKKALKIMPCPSDPPDTMSGPVGPSAYAVNIKVCKEGEGLSLDYITKKDGASNTLLLSENLRRDKAHNWWDTDPRTVTFTDGRMADNLRSNHPGGVNAAFCDGHVMFLSNDIEPAVYRALVTPDGGEEIDDSAY